MTDILTTAAELYTNASTGEWILDTEEATVTKALYDEVVALRAVIGRCEARSGSASNARCDRVTGHTGAHESSDRGFIVWTNRDDWQPAAE